MNGYDAIFGHEEDDMDWDYWDMAEYPPVMNLIEEYKLDPKYALGENGMPALKDTGHELVNLFGTIGGYRGRTEKDIIKLFQASFLKYPEPTLKCLFHIRDCRGGMGEIRIFRVILDWLGNHYPKIIRQYLHLVPEYGRWDDLFVFMDDTFDGTDLQRDSAFIWLAAIMDKNFLAAKWAPRENKKHNNIANKLRKLWNLSAKNYRFLLSRNTKVVETLMCNRAWREIVYQQVPSQAMLKYRKAFARHDPDFTKYLEAVKKGEVKINAKTLLPHQIVEQALESGKDPTLEALWNNLPDYMQGAELSVIPVSDVSDSMLRGNPSPMVVSVALGMYIAERNRGPYANLIYMFANDPTPVKLKGDFFNRVRQVRKGHWGGSTNLEAIFEHILGIATKNKIHPDHMPKYIIILSDMQFNQCEGGRRSTALEMIDDKYKQYGYERAKIIFWNLRASVGHPVEFDKNGTAMVSGFSPSIMESILNLDLEAINEAFNPLNVCLKTLYSKRYESIRL